MGNKLGLALVSSLAASARTLVGDRGTLYKTGAGALEAISPGTIAIFR